MSSGTFLDHLVPDFFSHLTHLNTQCQTQTWEKCLMILISSWHELSTQNERTQKGEISGVSAAAAVV